MESHPGYQNISENHLSECKSRTEKPCAELVSWLNVGKVLAAQAESMGP